jgi:hypothetical protein
MKDFPEFIKNPVNKISVASQYALGIEGYVFDGADGSQVAYWTYNKAGQSPAHSHEYDEYMVVVQGQYTLIIEGKKIPLKAGQEYLIKKALFMEVKRSLGRELLMPSAEKGLSVREKFNGKINQKLKYLL